MKLKTNLSKALSLIFAVVIMVASFSGCSGSGKRNIKGKKEIQIAYWQAGYGEEWLKAVIEAFEEKYTEYYVNYQATASHASVIAPFGMDDVDKNDLYLDIKNMDTEYMEPLDDILATTADGDKKTIGEKMNQSYLAYEKSSDGKCYTLSYGGGIMGFYYNADLLKKAGITQFPRTTNELITVCDKLYGKGITPLCHFTGGGYYVYLLQEYMAQYDGFDYYLKNFFGCTDKSGNSPSKAVFTEKDGRYYALKAFEKFITPEYTLAGSNTMSHTEIQTQFLEKSAAMMLNGTWVANEMKIEKDDNTVKCAKLPVLSAVVNKLTTVKSDSDLRKVIDAVDSITDGKKQVSDYASGDSYEVDGLTVSAEDWNKIYDARNTVVGNAAQQSLFIPKYSDSKEGAKKFVEFLLSDEGYAIYAEKTGCPLPLQLSTGKDVDTSNLSELQKAPFETWKNAKIYVDSGVSSKHPIFASGGADILAGVTYVSEFSTYNKNDRKKADEIWNKVIETVNEKYEIWLKTMKGE